MANATAINGEVHDWSDVKILVAGKEFKGVSSINWSQKKDKALQHGQGSAPIGVGYGNKTYEVSFKMTKKDAARFASVANAAGKDETDYSPFPIIVTFRDKIDSGGVIGWSPMQVVTLNYVDITDVSNSQDQGAQKIEVEYTAVCGGIIQSPEVS